MKTKRLYYSDSYTTRFKANIIERVKANGRHAVILDQTYFYPTSGGQPHDTGRLNDTAVTNVTIREADGAILHWLGQGEIWFDAVVGEIDWTRRFDHMQQHTGQHILSQAFLQTAEAETIGFHLSDNSVTIDLNNLDLQPEQIEQAEFLANQVIWQNRRIKVRWATAEQAQKLPLRKIPPAREGKLRLIEIDKFDLTACGGTHTAATGSVGQIKILKLERRRDKLRVAFACGQRALQDYRLKNSIVNNLTAQLTTGAPELPATITKMQAEAKENRRLLKRQQTVLLKIQAQALRDTAVKHGRVTLVNHVFRDDELDLGQLRALSSQITRQNSQTIALLGIAGKKSFLMFNRSSDAPGEMNQLLKVAMQALGSDAGGGSAVTAQGGGPAASVEKVQQAINRAEKLLRGSLK